jgi:hypothetical protein
VLIWTLVAVLLKGVGPRVGPEHCTLSFCCFIFQAAKAVGQVAPDAGVKAVRDPCPGHDSFVTETPGDFEFAWIALERGAQLLAGPAQTTQFFANDVFGALFLGLAHFFSIDVFGVGRPHCVQQFGTKLSTAQNPAATDFLIHLLITFPTAQFHAFGEFLAARRTVFGYAGFAEDAINSQPNRACGAGFEVRRIAAPGIIAEVMAALEQVGARGIEMDVIANGAQVTGSAAVNDERLVTTAEEVAEVSVAAIEARGVRAQEPFHPGYEVGPRGFDDEMKVIAHQAISMNLPTGFRARFAQRFEEQFTIGIAFEDVFTAVATIHHVVNGAFIFNAQFARHSRRA